ncbi:hypothetical protein P8452_57031 [Trifolium repens]|nr:hypothetical protein P8452_57031 [Trifolium repens]
MRNQTRHDPLSFSLFHIIIIFIHSLPFSSSLILHPLSFSLSFLFSSSSPILQSFIINSHPLHLPSLSLSELILGLFLVCYIDL